MINCETTMQVWGKLRSIYEGDKRVREAKLQVFLAKFEDLHMADDESVDEFFT